jgi:GT2 family glycosyltransferase
MLFKSGDDEPRVYIVPLNWNGWPDTVECVRSLGSMRYSNWHLIIVDTGSTDDSVKQLRKAPTVPVIGNVNKLLQEIVSVYASH